jgi:hypothetical protein
MCLILNITATFTTARNLFLTLELCPHTYIPLLSIRFNIILLSRLSLPFNFPTRFRVQTFMHFSYFPVSENKP